MLQEIPVYFQWVPLTNGSSMQHGRDMKGIIFPGNKQPTRTLLEALVEVATAYLERLGRQHYRRAQAQALGRRGDWKKGDGRPLNRLFAGEAKPATQRRILLLGELKGKAAQGRPVVDVPKKLDQQIIGAVQFCTELWSADTPPETRRELYKQTKWFPYFVESAYRGELRAAKLAAGGKRKSLHDGALLSPSEKAKQTVASAAGISVSLLDKLCDKVRKERKGDPPNDRQDCRETSAAELARHLENGPGI
jgi:hypothetical protein